MKSLVTALLLLFLATPIWAQDGRNITIPRLPEKIGMAGTDNQEAIANSGTNVLIDIVAGHYGFGFFAAQSGVVAVILVNGSNPPAIIQTTLGGISVTSLPILSAMGVYVGSGHLNLVAGPTAGTNFVFQYWGL